MKAANDNQIERTREIWQPRLGHDIGPDEAEQIAANIVGFFSVMAEWALAEQSAPANDNADSADEEGEHHDG